MSSVMSSAWLYAGLAVEEASARFGLWVAEETEEKDEGVVSRSASFDSPSRLRLS